MRLLAGIRQEDDLKDEEATLEASKHWWQSIWVHNFLIWFPILFSACLFIAGIVLVIFFRGRVRVTSVHLLLPCLQHFTGSGSFACMPCGQAALWHCASPAVICPIPGMPVAPWCSYRSCFSAVLRLV